MNLPETHQSTIHMRTNIYALKCLSGTVQVTFYSLRISSTVTALSIVPAECIISKYDIIILIKIVNSSKLCCIENMQVFVRYP